jgi:uncharacterized protein YggE
MKALPFHPTLTAVAVLAALAAAPALAADSDSRLERTVSVSGTGEVTAIPDTASVSVGVVTEDSEAGKAVHQNNQQVEELLKAIRRAGIGNQDIQTQSFSVSPRYGRPQPNGSPRIEGYRAANTVSVQVRNLKNLGKLLDTMIESGANQMNGVRFFVDQTEKLLDEARRRAVADARRKAQLYAGAADVRLGRVIEISEGAIAAPGPVLRTLSRASAESVPIAQGEQTLRVSVSVTYALE